MNLILVPLSTADGTGHVDVRSLSDKSLMELFVSGIDDVQMAKDEKGNFSDISTWSVLAFDSAQHLISISMLEMDTDINRADDRSIATSCFFPGGHIDFQFVPRTATSLKIDDLELVGTLETATLPVGLTKRWLTGNAIQGPFDVAHKLCKQVGFHGKY